MLKERSNQISQHTLVLNFLIGTNERHISLRTKTTGDRHNSTSPMQPSIDPGTKRGDSNDGNKITNIQHDATFAHSSNVSRVQVVNILMPISKHVKGQSITTSIRYAGGRHRKNRQETRGSRRERRSHREDVSGPEKVVYPSQLSTWIVEPLA